MKSIYGALHMVCAACLTVPSCTLTGSALDPSTITQHEFGRDLMQNDGPFGTPEKDPRRLDETSRSGWKLVQSLGDDALVTSKKEEDVFMGVSGGILKVETDGFDMDPKMEWSLRMFVSGPGKTSQSFGSAKSVIFLSTSQAVFAVPPLHGHIGVYTVELSARSPGSRTSFVHPIQNTVRTYGNCMHPSTDTAFVLYYVRRFDNVSLECSGRSVSLEIDGVQLDPVKVNCTSDPQSRAETRALAKTFNNALREANLGDDLTVPGKLIRHERFVGIQVWLVPFLFAKERGPLQLDLLNNRTTNTILSGGSFWRYICKACPKRLVASGNRLCMMTDGARNKERLEQNAPLLKNRQLRKLLRSSLSDYSSVQCVELSTGVRIRTPSLRDIRVLGGKVFDADWLKQLYTMNLDFDSENLGELVLQAANIRAVVTNRDEICLLFSTVFLPLCWSVEKLVNPLSAKLPPLEYYNFAFNSKSRHVCSISGNGTLTCFGSNVYLVSVPPQRQGLPYCTPLLGSYEQEPLDYIRSGGILCTSNDVSYSQVSVSSGYSCAIESMTGALSCWGNGQYHRHGPCDTGDVYCNSFAGPVRQVKTGILHTCALWQNGTVSCWGINSFDQVDGAPHHSERFIAVDTGRRHSCAITAEGGFVKCWGADKHGETAAPNVGGFLEIALGQSFSCGLLRNSTGRLQVVCWGDIHTNQLGVQLFGEPNQVQGKQKSMVNDTFYQALVLESLDGEPITPFITHCKLCDKCSMAYMNTTSITQARQLVNETVSCLSLFQTTNCTSTVRGDTYNGSTLIGFDGTADGLNQLSCSMSEFTVNQSTDTMECAPFGEYMYSHAYVTTNSMLFQVVFYGLLAIFTLAALGYDNRLS